MDFWEFNKVFILVFYCIVLSRDCIYRFVLYIFEIFRRLSKLRLLLHYYYYYYYYHYYYYYYYYYCNSFEKIPPKSNVTVLCNVYLDNRVFLNTQFFLSFNIVCLCITENVQLMARTVVFLLSNVWNTNMTSSQWRHYILISHYRHVFIHMCEFKLYRKLWCRWNKNEISNWSSVGYIKRLQFYNWFRLHQTLDQL